MFNKKQLLILIFIMTSLFGCASIQIDMDVYKGPFANHEEVEVEQFAVLAAAAKPILIKLQTLLVDDKLRESQGNDYKPECPDYNNQTTCKDYYLANQIMENTREPAHFINEILALYNDRDYGTSSLLDDIEISLLKYNSYHKATRLVDTTKTLDEIVNQLFELIHIVNINKNIRVKNKFNSDIVDYFDFMFRVRNLAIVYQVSICNSESVDMKKFIKLMKENGAGNRWSCDGESHYSDWSYVSKSDKEALKLTFLESPVITINAIEQLRSIDLSDKSQRKVISYNKCKVIDKKDENSDNAAKNSECALQKFFNSNRRTLPNRKSVVCSNNTDKVKCPWNIENEYKYAKTWTTKANYPAGVNPSETIAQFRNLIDKISKSGSFGDTQGSKGIETLIKKYIDTSEKCSDRKEQCFNIKQKTLEMLNFALIRFAQKIIYLADNEVLLGSNFKQQSTWNDDNYWSDETTLTSKSQYAAINQHIRVLQAIGNTIIVLADDVRRLDQQNDPALVEMEAAAAKRALITNPKSRLRALIKAISSQKDSNDIAIKELKSEISKLNEETKKYTRQLNGLDVENEFDKEKDRNTLIKYEKTNSEKLNAYRLVVKKYSKRIQKDLINNKKIKVKVKGKKFRDEIWEKIKIYAGEEDVDEKVLALVKKGISTLGKTYDDKELSYEKIWGEYKKILTKDSESLDQLLSIVEKISNLSEKHKKRVDSKDAQTIAKEKLINIEESVIDIDTEVGSSSGSIFYKWLEKKVNAFDDSKVILQVLKEHAISIDIEPPRADLLLTKEKPNRTDVMDQLINELKYAHISAINKSGENSSEAVRLKAALDAAYDYKGGMAYIRPAGTYLRSSFAATTLQTGSNIYRWKNMLQDQTQRALIPFYHSDLKTENDKRVLAEIDKQFWQTINSVRLSGGGNTNYVIAKDDVGNFYVKGVQTEVDDIVESMKGLALYGLGDKVNMLNRDPVTNKITIDGNTTPMQSVYKKYEDRFIASTQGVLQSSLDLLDAKKKEPKDDVSDYKSGLLQRIVSLWKEDTDNTEPLTATLESSSTVLQTAYDNFEGQRVELNNEAGKSGAEGWPKSLDTGQILIEILHVIRKFYLTLDAELSGVTLTANANQSVEQQRYALRNSVADIINTEITGIAESRLRALDEFETGVTVLGEITSESNETKELNEDKTETPDDSTDVESLLDEGLEDS